MIQAWKSAHICKIRTSQVHAQLEAYERNRALFCNPKAIRWQPKYSRVKTTGRS